MNFWKIEKESERISYFTLDVIMNTPKKKKDNDNDSNQNNFILKKKKKKIILPINQESIENNMNLDLKKKKKKKIILESQENQNQNTSQFKPYPEITSNTFYQDIYEKKEFRDHEILSSDIHDESSCNPQEFNLSPFQSFLKNYISTDTPYNGILVMYSTGVGKTCAAISIAEGFKKTLKEMGKRILVLTTLRKNFEKELFNFKKEEQKKSMDEIVQCTGREYELPPSFKHYSLAQKKKEISKMIRSYYQFFGYQKFANYIIKMTGGWNGSEETITEPIRKFIHKEFDNRVIIIDEVHNIKTDVKEEWKKSIQPILLNVLRIANNTKLILMSATPMFDRPDEIIYILNLLLANDKRELIQKQDIFEKNGSLKEEAQELLARLLKGYVSYARGEKPLQFPFRLYSADSHVPDIEYTMNGKKIEEEKRLKFTKIVECPMESIQNATYAHFVEKKMKEGKFKQEIETEDLSEIQNQDNEIENVEETENEEEINIPKKKKSSQNNNNNNNAQPKSILNNLTYISNIVYPTTFKENHENKNEDVSMYGSYGKEGIDNDNDNGRGGFYKVHHQENGSKYVQYKYQEHAIINQGKSSQAPFIDERYLEEYSAKFAKILFELKRAQGLCFVYSLYVDDGILPLALMLEQNGFERATVKGENRLLDVPIAGSGKWGKRPPICYHCGKTLKDGNHNKEEKGSHAFYRAKYVLYFGESKDIIKTTKESALERFTSRTNKNGEEIKVFLGTKTVSEGLNFQRIRQVHILEPWHNLSRHEQIIGRAIRTCSHQDLPLEHRNVEIFQYAAVLNPKTRGIKRKTETIDLKYYRNAENKDRIIKKITRILKESAIDCNLFYKHNIIDSNETFHQITASGQDLTVPVKDEPFSPMCDYEEDCHYKCQWKKDPKKTYPINTDTYNLRFGTQDIIVAKRFIKEIFRKHNVYHLKDIVKEVKQLNPKLDTDFIFIALDDYVNSPKQEILVDKFKRKGYLLYRGDYYIFQPLGLREDIPILYREKPSNYKPDMISLENIDVNYEEPNQEEVENRMVMMKKRNKMVMISENSSLMKTFISTFKDRYAMHKRMMEEATEREYELALIGFLIDKMRKEEYIQFMSAVLKRFLENHLLGENGKEMEMIEKIIEYQSKSLIQYRDIRFQYQEKSKKRQKEIMNLYIGFREGEDYYILKPFNEDIEYSIEDIHQNEIRFVKSNQEIVRIMKQKEQLKMNTNQKKNTEFNKIYGFLVWDKNKNQYVFKLINREAEKGILTKEKKISVRAMSRGHDCATYKVPEIMDFRRRLNLYLVEGVLKRDFLCHDIEIYLRYQQEIEKKTNGKVIYFLSESQN